MQTVYPACCAGGDRGHVILGSGRGHRPEVGCRLPPARARTWHIRTAAAVPVGKLAADQTDEPPATDLQHGSILHRDDKANV